MTTTTVIHDVLLGKVAELDALIGVTDLPDVGGTATTWRLGAHAVARVVAGYSAGDISAEQAQSWAFFVRHGFMQSASLPVTPLDIEWDADREEAIAEATMRLEELGDLVDGELRDGEAQELIQRLCD